MWYAGFVNNSLHIYTERVSDSFCQNSAHQRPRYSDFKTGKEEELDSNSGRAYQPKSLEIFCDFLRNESQYTLKSHRKTLHEGHLPPP